LESSLLHLGSATVVEKRRVSTRSHEEGVAVEKPRRE
jgi:hypothetical protein